jgi:transcriptional regulator with XRE-family HTH domain
MPKAAVTKRESEKKRQSAAFGRAVYELRIKASLSQEQLALESGVGRSYISVLERGDKEPCLGIMFKLARALKTDAQAIVGLTEQIYRAGYSPNPGSNARVR